MSEKWMKCVVVGSVLVTITLTLACGGGGGGGGGGVTPTLEITTDNQNEVSDAAIGSTDTMITSSQNINLGNKPSVSAAGIAGLAGLTTDVVGSLGKAGSESGDVSYAVEEQIEDYPDGGTATITVNDADNNGAVSRGDTITSVFDNATDGTTVIDGTMSIRLTSLSVNQATGDFSFSAIVTVTDFTITQDGASTEMDGSYTISINVRESTDSVTGSIVSPSMSVVEDASSWTLSSFAVSYTSDTAADEYSYTTKGVLDSTDLGGIIRFVTTSAFEGTGDGDPTSGEMVIYGADGATLTVTALETGFVQLDLDSDGDGTVDNISQVDW